MYRTHAIVLTYPGHFLLTKLTIDQLYQTQPEVNRITVIVDDISNLAWQTYISDCDSLYDNRVDQIIQLSHYREFKRLRNYPWLRQQTVKLYLDRLFPNDEFVFFIDGDVLLHKHVPLGITPFSFTEYSGVPLTERDPGPGEITSQQSYYVQHLLGRPHLGIQYQGRRVCVSSPPFRDICLTQLPLLRAEIYNRFNQDLIGIHVAIATDTRHSASEWELLAWYQQEFLQQPVVLDYWPTSKVGDPITSTTLVSTCWCSDREIDTDWWDQNQIDWQRYWQLLPESK